MYDVEKCSAVLKNAAGCVDIITAFTLFVSAALSSLLLSF